MDGRLWDGGVEMAGWVPWLFGVDQAAYVSLAGQAASLGAFRMPPHAANSAQPSQPTAGPAIPDRAPVRLTRPTPLRPGAAAITRRAPLETPRTQYANSGTTSSEIGASQHQHPGTSQYPAATGRGSLPPASAGVSRQPRHHQQQQPADSARSTARARAGTIRRLRSVPLADGLRARHSL